MQNNVKIQTEADLLWKQAVPTQDCRDLCVHGYRLIKPQKFSSWNLKIRFIIFVRSRSFDSSKQWLPQLKRTEPLIHVCIPHQLTDIAAVHIHLRAETKPAKHRSALTPTTTAVLLKAGPFNTPWNSLTNRLQSFRWKKRPANLWRCRIWRVIPNREINFLTTFSVGAELVELN
jgi:hypothetical protein